MIAKRHPAPSHAVAHLDGYTGIKSRFEKCSAKRGKLAGHSFHFFSKCRFCL